MLDAPTLLPHDAATAALASDGAELASDYSLTQKQQQALIDHLEEFEFLVGGTG